MSKAGEALTDVRELLCDNLSEGDAGKVCGMLSVVSRQIAELEDENAELKKAMDFQALELGCMTDNRDILHLENEKLRKLLSSALIVAGFKGRQYLDTYLKEEEGTTLWQELEGLGIEATNE